MDNTLATAGLKDTFSLVLFGGESGTGAYTCWTLTDWLQRMLRFPTAQAQIVSLARAISLSSTVGVRFTVIKAM